MAGWLAEPRRRAVVVLAATLVGMGVTARLGLWQLDRAAQKEAWQHSLDSRSSLPELGRFELPVSENEAHAQHYRRVRLRGEWKPGADVFLDNRPLEGAVMWECRFCFHTHLPVTPACKKTVRLSGYITPPRDKIHLFAAHQSVK